MYSQADGTFLSDPFTVEGGFKIRFNRGWDINRGATGDVEPYIVTLGTTLDVVNNGKNLGIDAPAGQYVISYNKAGETLTVSAK